MLSITGMTLEQFANLMQGLGYRAEKAERIKVKAAAAAPVAEEPASDADVGGDGAPETVEPAPETVPEDAPKSEMPSSELQTPAVAAEAPAVEDPSAEDAAEEAVPVEMEVYYTFVWGANRANRAERSAGGPRKGQKPRGKPKQDGAAKGKGGKPGRSPDKAERYQARPPKRDKPIDPDNPFAAALMGFNKK
jgi:ATP-dependent RNA helicase SUPV3L1/SUV3